MKRVLLIALCASFLVALCGCAGFLEKEYVSVVEHSQTDNSNSSHEDAIDIRTYQELEAAIMGLVRSYSASGTLHFTSYKGNVDEDVRAACSEISNNTPLGAYAVFYMNSDVTWMVSYYEAEVSIAYKKTAEQVKNVISAPNEEDIQKELVKAINDYKQSVTILTYSQNISESLISGWMDEAYYSAATNVVFIPRFSVNAYPENSIVKIMEINFTYPGSVAKLQVMNNTLADVVKEYASDLGDKEQGEKLLLLCEKMIENVIYDSELEQSYSYNRWEQAHSAYGALINGVATSEGFAMAYQRLCQRIGAESYVVVGRKDNDIHAWNIVELDGHYYHIDVSYIAQTGIKEAFLRTDGDMLPEYLWNTDMYPACEGPVTYSDIVGQNSLRPSNGVVNPSEKPDVTGNPGETEVTPEPPITPTPSVPPVTPTPEEPEEPVEPGDNGE